MARSACRSSGYRLPERRVARSGGNFCGSWWPTTNQSVRCRPQEKAILRAGLVVSLETHALVASPARADAVVERAIALSTVERDFERARELAGDVGRAVSV